MRRENAWETCVTVRKVLLKSSSGSSKETLVRSSSGASLRSLPPARARRLLCERAKERERNRERERWMIVSGPTTLRFNHTHLTRRPRPALETTLKIRGFCSFSVSNFFFFS